MYSLFNQFLFLLLDRFSIDLDKSRELEVGIYWRDWRSLCAIKFLRLEEFIDDIRHGMALQLEPQGLLFAEVISLLPSEFAEILRTVLLFFFWFLPFFPLVDSVVIFLCFQIKFLNPMISRKPKLRRQRKIFKQQVKNFPRATQMNINVATWGRLLKRSSPSIQHNNNHGNSRSASESPPSGRSIRQLKLGENGNRHINGGHLTSSILYPCFVYNSFQFNF